MYRYFLFFLVFFLLETTLWASSIFTDKTSEEISQMPKVLFLQGVKNINLELFSKLAPVQQEAIRHRIKEKNEISQLPPFLKPVSPSAKNLPVKRSPMPLPKKTNPKSFFKEKGPSSKVMPVKKNLLSSEPVQPMPILKREKKVEIYTSTENLLKSLKSFRIFSLLERDIPLSKQYERSAEEDPFYIQLSKFDFQNDVTVVYNNDAYWEGLRKEKPNSVLIEEQKLIKGKPLTSEWKNSQNQTIFNPVGYPLYLPKNPKAILILAYGGEQIQTGVVSYFSSFHGFPMMVIRYLLSQNIAIMDLDTIDQLKNDVHQIKMSEDMYIQVMECLKTAVEVVSSPSKAQSLSKVLKDLPNNLPVYLGGASFGAGLSLRFLQEYSDKVKINGVISFNGLLVGSSEMGEERKFQNYMIPSLYLEKLNGNALLIQNYNDNNVHAIELLKFYQKAQNLGKAEWLKFMIYPEGNLEKKPLQVWGINLHDPNREYTGHFYSDKYLYQKRLALMIEDFIQQTKSGPIKFPSQLNDMRYLYHQISYNQYLNESSFKDKFFSIAFKIYQNSLQLKSYNKKEIQKKIEENSFMAYWFKVLKKLSGFEKPKDFVQTSLNFELKKNDINSLNRIENLQEEKNENGAWDNVYVPILIKLLVNEIVNGQYDSSKSGEIQLPKLRFYKNEVIDLGIEILSLFFNNPSKEAAISLLEDFFQPSGNLSVTFKPKILSVKDKETSTLFLYFLFMGYKEQITDFTDWRKDFDTLRQNCKRQLSSVFLSQVKQAKQLLKENSEIQKDYKTVLGSQITSLKKEAIEKKDPKWAKQMADMYYKGLNVEQNYTYAAEFYKVAADLGDAESKYMLALMYKIGEGVAKNPSKSNFYFASAISAGYKYEKNFFNTFEANDLFEIGTRVVEEKAFPFFQLALEKGSILAKFYLGKAYLYGEIKGITQDLNKGLELLTQAANSDYIPAITLLAILYSSSSLIPQDYKKAADLYENLLKKGDYVENYKKMYLAGWYREGKGSLGKNPLRAAEIYEMIFNEIKDTEASEYLADMYFLGEGVEQDYQKAAELYTQSKYGMSRPLSYENFAWMYENGKGVPKDIKKAAELYFKSAEMYVNGFGSPKNEQKALEYFKKSAELGNEKALEFLQNRQK